MKGSPNEETSATHMPHDIKLLVSISMQKKYYFIKMHSCTLSAHALSSLQLGLIEANICGIRASKLSQEKICKNILVLTHENIASLNGPWLTNQLSSHTQHHPAVTTTGTIGQQ